jgi:phosphoglycolate phosphatase-like HAD superfamily hydrolase
MKAKGGNLIVFDWNGTILADTSACLRATNTVLDKLGKPRATIAQYRHHYTMPLNKLYYALGIDADTIEKHAPVIHPLWHETYSAANIRLRRGARAMLQSMRTAKCEAIILSNYVVHRIEAQAQKFGVREHFREILAYEVGDATFRMRGKGARLKEYLRANPVHKGMIIGDSEEEVEIGRELGLTTVAITDGMCSTARLRAMKPDYLVQSLAQVPPIAHHLFGGSARAAS